MATPVNYYSDRKIPLIYQENPLDKPVLTLENWPKWYDFYVVMPDGAVRSGPPIQLEDAPVPTPFLDHCPHPDVYVWLCRQFGYALDMRTLEVILGRWMLEYFGDGTGGKELSKQLNLKCLVTYDVEEEPA